MIDIAIARITHIGWERQLKSLLSNKHEYIKISDHRSCNLGLWLYDSAIERYDDIPEVRLLEEEHRLFHLAADRIIKWHNKPGVSIKAEAQSQIDYEEVTRRSREIIYLLTILEFELVHQTQSWHAIKSPLRKLKQIFSRR